MKYEPQVIITVSFPETIGLVLILIIFLVNTIVVLITNKIIKLFGAQ